MSGPTRRELERKVETLREDADREGFHHFRISYTPNGEDQERSGYYEWDAERGEYINENGRTMTPEDAPESEFEYEIEYE